MLGMLCAASLQIGTRVDVRPADLVLLHYQCSRMPDIISVWGSGLHAEEELPVRPSNAQECLREWMP